MEEDVGRIQQTGGLQSAKAFVEHIFDPKKKYMDGQLYLELLQQIIPKVAERDNIIILGRGAQFILSNRKDTYHILMVADEEDRIKFLMDQYGISSAEATQATKKQGKRREKLMKLFHSEDYNQPWHYDVVLNMSKLDMEHAAHLVCSIL